MELKEHFSVGIAKGTNIAKNLKSLEAHYIEHVHKQTRYNQSKTAIALGMSRGTLRAKLKEYFQDKYIGEKE